MNGPEHYREAERLVDRAESGVRLDPGDPWLLLAQVHATLALAAATAYPAIKDYCGEEIRVDAREWAEVTH